MHYRDFILHKARCGHIKKHLKRQEFPSIVEGIKKLEGKIECDNWELNYGLWRENYYYSNRITEKQFSKLIIQYKWTQLDKQKEYLECTSI